MIRPLALTTLIFLTVSAARAATFTVTTTADSGAGSLRQALIDAAALGGADVIGFDPSLSGQTITLTSGALSIGDAAGVTVDALSLPAGLTLQGNGADRVILNTGTLTLRGLTISGGVLPACCGGAGIYSTGNLTVDRCTLSGNNAGYGGGALFNDGTATITASTLTANYGGLGAALYNRNGGMTVIESTIAGNQANTDFSVYNDGTLSLKHCTVSGNVSVGNYGGMYNNTARAFTLENSIIGGNSGLTDLANYGSLARAGANLSQVAPQNFGSGSISGSGTIVIAAAQLGALGDNGGPTRTMAPQPGSPAIDAAVSSVETQDQRGRPRPLDGDGNGSAVADIGAVEFASSVADLSGLSLSVGTLTPAFNTATVNYAAAVQAASLTVTPTLAHLGASVTVNGTPVASGNPSGAIGLAPGANTIPVVVTAQDGVTTRTYTVIVTRAIVVTNTADSGAGSLRQALVDAASIAGADLITFAPALSGTTITLTSGPLALGDATGPVTIDASALPAGLTLNGGGTGRIVVNSNTSGNTMAYLTFTGGFCNSTSGGGAILNNGLLIVERSTFINNHCGYGGAIYAIDGANTTVRQSTFSGNVADNYGGALYFLGFSQLTHCTVTGNTAFAGGGLFNGYYHTLYNSIVAGNSGSPGQGVDVGNFSQVSGGGVLTVAGANIVPQLTSCLFCVVNGSGTISTADPLLQPLGNYGGPTQTRLPMSNSPAIDAAQASGYTVDQRGFPRPVDGDGNGAAAPDIGAVEFGNANLSNLTTTAGPLSPAFSGATTGYAVNATYMTSSATVTPTAAQAGATIKVNGVTVASGSPSGALALSYGDNLVSVAVTATDGVSVKLYTLTITRAPCPTPALALGALVLRKGATAGTVTLSFQDGNDAATVTGSNIRRVSTLTAPGPSWPLIGANIQDQDIGTAGIQWTDATGDVSPSGSFFYQATAYNSYCATEGPF